MLYLAAKTAITAILVVAIGEVAKRSPLLAGLLASLPLTSVLAITWLYLDTGSSQDVIALSRSVLLMLFPSLVFFVALPIGLGLGLSFPVALTAAIGITGGTYAAYLKLLEYFGVAI